MELPDKKLDKRLNLGCGGVLGFFIGFFSVMGSGAELAESLLAGLAIGLGLAFLTLIFGDRLLGWMLGGWWVP